jgi:hypothetical protein
MDVSEIGLGRFGDRRLEKGGPSCWLGCWLWAGKGSGFDVWGAIGPVKSV